MPADRAFTVVADNDPLPEGPAIVSLARFQKERDALLARGEKLAASPGSRRNRPS